MSKSDYGQRSQEAYTAAALRNGKSPATPGREDCTDCGDDIPEERREAVPSATRCIGCQEKHERVG